MRNGTQKAVWTLRVGLGVTFLYSGLDLIRNPINWVGYMPQWFSSLLPVDPMLYVQFQGGIEILFAVAFLMGFFLRPAALLAALEFGAIMLFSGIDPVTFRDFGLLGASLALFFLPSGPVGKKQDTRNGKQTVNKE